MDDEIGKVVAALETKKMRDSTLIVFMSDNGGNTLDGMDVWPTISQGAPSPRTEVVYNMEPFRGGVRQVTGSSSGALRCLRTRALQHGSRSFGKNQSRRQESAENR